MKAGNHSGSLCFTLQGTFQSLIECGFGFLIIRLRDFALLTLGLKLEKFFLDSFHQPGSRAGARAGHVSSNDFSGLVIVFFLHAHGYGSLLLPQTARRRLLSRRDVNASDNQECGEASKNPPAIPLQRIGSIDRRAQTSAGAVVGLRGGCSASRTLLVFAWRLRA